MRNVNIAIIITISMALMGCQTTQRATDGELSSKQLMSHGGTSSKGCGSQERGWSWGPAFALSKGQPILAVAKGKIVQVGNYKDDSNRSTVVLDVDGLDKNVGYLGGIEATVKAGDRVNIGDQVGTAKSVAWLYCGSIAYIKMTMPPEGHDHLQSAGGSWREVFDADFMKFVSDKPFSNDQRAGKLRAPFKGAKE